MIIGNPKVRKVLNSIVDNICIAVFFVILPFAIIFGIIAGIFKKLF